MTGTSPTQPNKDSVIRKCGWACNRIYASDRLYIYNTVKTEYKDWYNIFEVVWTSHYLLNLSTSSLNMKFSIYSFTKNLATTLCSVSNTIHYFNVQMHKLIIPSSESKNGARIFLLKLESGNEWQLECSLVQNETSCQISKWYVPTCIPLKQKQE